jgi:membrane associated rhomboid family serine protease
MRAGRAAVAATRAGGAGGYLRRLLPHGVPIVTYALMALCVVVYIGQLVSGGAVTDAGVLDPRYVATEPWRMITSAFLHSPQSFLHILFNLYALFIFGPALEQFLGRVRFLALYLVTALGGSVGVVLVYQLWIVSGHASEHWLGTLLSPASSLGASGAIFGLLGAIIALRKAMGVQSMQLLIVVVANLAISFFVPGIAWEAHLGGLLTGLAIGYVFLRTRRNRQRPVQVVAVVGVAILLVLITLWCVLSERAQYF